MQSHLLAINGGSSSIKFAVFSAGESPQKTMSGAIDRIGLAGATLKTTNAGEAKASEQPIAAADHQQAVGHLVDWLQQQNVLDSVTAIGHRVVHGGPKYWQSVRITDDVVAELRRISPWDPAHVPSEIALIEAFAARLPRVPQVACFDTAFHHRLPRVAQILPIPRCYQEQGVRRYGFHGISYAYLMEELRHVAGDNVANGRVILAHLGAGASMAAVRDGQCIDTTMAFTPNAGLMMATRCGDLDPGLLVHLLRSEQLTADQLEDLITRRSGLLGVSGTSSDMRDLLANQNDARAAEAVDLFCYTAKKWIGALTASLGGLDTLVFAGGIGEHSSEVRKRICQGLEFLGVKIDDAKNSSNAAVISVGSSSVAVRVIPTDEELMIAREIPRTLTEKK